MNVTVLQAGAPPEALSEQFGSYGSMVKLLLGTEFCVSIRDVRSELLPGPSDPTEGYIITGSSSGAYDADPWIERLQTFIRATAGSRPMVGICFGHQLMAQALGGSVVKSPKGWGIGLHRYDVCGSAPWLGSAKSFSLPASHQDQVVAIGPDAEVLAESAFTPFAVLAYPKLRAMSLQPHPEFAPDFAKALIHLRRGSRFDITFADMALASLEQPNDQTEVQRWLRRFLLTS